VARSGRQHRVLVGSCTWMAKQNSRIGYQRLSFEAFSRQTMFDHRYLSRYIQINPWSKIPVLESQRKPYRDLLQKPTPTMMLSKSIWYHSQCLHTLHRPNLLPPSSPPTSSSEWNGIAHFPTRINWITKHSVITIS
jgi:hypothetical protein